MPDDEVRELSAQQILNQSADYPPMADSECQMSTIILSAAYPELRYVKGTRRRIYAVPGTKPEATEVTHWWNERADGTIIDSAFQPGPATTKNLPYVTQRYVEGEISKTERQEIDRTVRSLRNEIRRRARNGTGTAQERRRQVVEELRDDLPRLRRDFAPGTTLQPRRLHGDDAIAASTPDGTPADPEIPPAFGGRR